jgi:hypothetical protein
VVVDKAPSFKNIFLVKSNKIKFFIFLFLIFKLSVLDDYKNSNETLKYQNRENVMV